MKQFVHNRVAEIREHTTQLLEALTRGVSPVELLEKLGLWLNGPPTSSLLQSPTESGETVTTPEQCLVEIKTQSAIL